MNLKRALFAALASSISVSALLLAQTGKRSPKPEAPAAPSGPSVDALMLKSLKARSIGPAVMSGRVSDIALDPKDPYTFYVALGTGGLMKTSDDGGTWQALFEKQAVAAVGDVTLAPSNPKILWLGTGEANDRNSSGWGDGVYRSTDGGETWTRAGLERTRTIARIVVHPENADVAWVCAPGDLWGPNPERGLYRTSDGGKSWTAVLAAPAAYNTRVGCGDVAIDPTNSDTLYAALYARQRTPWSFWYGPAASEGKDLGGIFKSTDGGASWRKLETGLPRATGRIGLDVHRKDPRIVYAIVQSDEGGASGIDDVRSKRGGVFRSEDAGESWTRMSPLNPRPFYFSRIRVDPEEDQRVYVLGFALHVSEDGGRSFREDRFGKIHPDCHALAIDPRDPRRLLLGTDGGAYQSVNRGETWEHLNRFAAAEYYRINLDMSVPYRICGGLQDNLSWVGPSLTRNEEGILNSDWISLGGGDGFYCVFDADDPEIVYYESQTADLERIDLRSGQRTRLRPEPAEGQPAFRFHWNSPLLGSRHAKGALYLAGNRLFRLTERGEHWTPISPDLSAQDPQKTTAVGSGAEVYGVVYALAESPVKPGLLWAGTDDGKLWVTENDGGSWTDLTGSLPAPARGQWISRIEASSHDAKVAYLAVDAHRSQNNAPLAYRTADGGRTWLSLAGDLPTHGPVKVVREDPRNPDLLYAGTEFGLFVSLDRGGHWTPFGSLPTVAVDDILVHPRDHDLVIATHGRSLYIVDDIRPLQELTHEVLGKPLHLFPPRPVTGSVRLPGFAAWNGSAVYRGENPAAGALLTFYVKQHTAEEVKLAIKNPAGQPVANLSAPDVPGLRRVVWDLKPTKDLLTEYGGEGQKLVRPGEYTVTLRHGHQESTQKLTVAMAKGIETR